MPEWWKRKSSKPKSTTNSCTPQKSDVVSSPASQKSNYLAHTLPVVVGGGGHGVGLGFVAVGHPCPLPLPTSLPLPAISHADVAVTGSVSGSASLSVSSVSSSGSSCDDTAETNEHGIYRRLNPIITPRGRNEASDQHRNHHVVEDGHFICSPVHEHGRFSDASVSHANELHLQNFDYRMSSNNIPSARRRRSLSPSSRGHADAEGKTRDTLTSPVHPREFGFGPRTEDIRSPPHPLPLPPIPLRTSHSLHSQWKKGRLLGSGTFGQVFLGFNSESGQMCAIKEVKVVSDDSNSKECLKQLNQEIALLSHLSHPNIVQYYGSELTDETLSIYLEYVSGGSIHKLLREYGAFKEPVIRSYTAQILCGLAYLHMRNTVHRDIKGANILVDPNGEVKLVDFGMAKHISSYNSIRSFKGSPYWMAPEVIMNTKGYGLSVDIWSLGCVILEMATSRPPWSKYEGVAAMFKIANSKEIPEVPEHFSDEGKSFLKLCLQRDPAARPAAALLMDHPFVQDQPAVRAAKSNMLRNTTRTSFDGSHTMSNGGISSKSSITPLREIRISSRDVSGFATTLPSPYRNYSPVSVRANKSLPVSPASSPSRQFRQSNWSGLPSPSLTTFSSPPHPSFSSRAEAYSFTTYAPNLRSTAIADPWPETPQLKARSPYGSPGRL